MQHPTTILRYLWSLRPITRRRHEREILAAEIRDIKGAMAAMNWLNKAENTQTELDRHFLQWKTAIEQAEDERDSSNALHAIAMVELANTRQELREARKSSAT